MTRNELEARMVLVGFMRFSVPDCLTYDKPKLFYRAVTERQPLKYHIIPSDEDEAEVQVFETAQKTWDFIEGQLND